MAPGCYEWFPEGEQAGIQQVGPDGQLCGEGATECSLMDLPVLPVLIWSQEQQEGPGLRKHRLVFLLTRLVLRESQYCLPIVRGKIVERLLLRPYDCVTLPSRSRGQDASGRACRWLSSIWSSAHRREEMVCLMRLQRGSLTSMVMDCIMWGLYTGCVCSLGRSLSQAKLGAWYGPKSSPPGAMCPKAKLCSRGMLEQNRTGGMGSAGLTGWSVLVPVT